MYRATYVIWRRRSTVVYMVIRVPTLTCDGTPLRTKRTARTNLEWGRAFARFGYRGGHELTNCPVPTMPSPCVTRGKYSAPLSIL